MQVSGKWKLVKWVLIVLNLLSELCQAILTQENGQGKIGTSSYLKLSIITSSCCFLLSVVEIIHEGKESRVPLMGRPRRDICWQGQLSGRFFLYFGIVSSTMQFIIDLVALLRKTNVVKFGIVPLLLSSGYLVAALVDPGENSMIMLRIHTSFPFFAFNISIRRTISSLSQRSQGQGVQQELVPQPQGEVEEEAPLIIRPNMVKLKSSDGEMFEVEEAVAMQSGVLRSRIEDGCPDDIIPLPNVTGRILLKVIEYCEKHAKELSDDQEELKTWDAEFVKVDKSTLFDLINAANYMEIESLLGLTIQFVAQQIEGKTPEEIRQVFGGARFTDMTEEEEEELKRENPWAFESVD